MNKLLSTVRGMVREARRVGQNQQARARSKAREAFAVAFQEMRAAVQSAPHGYPVGADRPGTRVVHIRMVAA